MVEQLGSHRVEVLSLQEQHEVLLVHLEAQVRDEHNLTIGIWVLVVLLSAWLGTVASILRLFLVIKAIVVCLLFISTHVSVLVVVALVTMIITCLTAELSWLSPILTTSTKSSLVEVTVAFVEASSVIVASIFLEATTSRVASSKVVSHVFLV